MKGPTTRQRLERKISFLSLFVYLFIYLFIFAIRISRFILFTFFGVFPHFFIRIRDLQVSGLHFTDTPLDTFNSEQCYDARIAG